MNDDRVLSKRGLASEAEVMAIVIENGLEGRGRGAIYFGQLIGGWLCIQTGLHDKMLAI